MMDKGKLRQRLCDVCIESVLCEAFMLYLAQMMGWWCTDRAASFVGLSIKSVLCEALCSTDDGLVQKELLLLIRYRSIDFY